MRIKRTLSILFLVFFCNFLFSQETVIYDKYPFGQEAYIGGKKKLYYDLHKALIDNKLENCEDSKQNYRVKLIVKKDSSILFVKNPDSVYISKNKCAYELSKKALKYIHDWKPAEHKEGKLNAMYEFDFYPSDLFQDYDENYVGVHIDKTIPQFPGGVGEFRQQFQKLYKMPDVDFRGEIKCDTSFQIDKEGRLVNIFSKCNPKMPKVERNIIEALQKVKGRWTLPKEYLTKDELYRMRFPLNFHFH